MFEVVYCVSVLFHWYAFIRTVVHFHIRQSDSIRSEAEDVRRQRKVMSSVCSCYHQTWTMEKNKLYTEMRNIIYTVSCVKITYVSY